MRRLLVLTTAVLLAACSHRTPEPVVPPASTAPRAIAVYRTIAESIYVGATKRVVAVAAASLDSACTQVTCADLAARWGVETLWWAHADASGAVRMSPVGFSRSGQTAVAFVDWRCGPTCGHTLGVALTATSDTTWSIAEMLLVSSRAR